MATWFPAADAETVEIPKPPRSLQDICAIFIARNPGTDIGGPETQVQVNEAGYWYWDRGASSTLEARNTRVETWLRVPVAIYGGVLYLSKDEYNGMATAATTGTPAKTTKRGRRGRTDYRDTTGMVQVTGPTYQVRDRLRALGGRWKPDEQRWYVPPDKADEARAIIDTQRLPR